MGGVKSDKKLRFYDMVNMQFNKILQLFTIYPFHGIKTPNIEWLKKI